MTNENALARTASITEPLNRRVVSDIALSQSFGGAQFTNMVEVMDFAKMMALSDLAVPKHLRNNPGACLAVTIQSIEMGMSPFALANKSYTVNDRLAYESAIYHAVAVKRIFKGRIRPTYSGSGNERSLNLAATLTSGEQVDYQSPEIGKITTKNSPLWKSDPDQQLFYYSVRAMVRRYFPDVMMGLYTDDEFEGEVTTITHGEPVSNQPEQTETEITLDQLGDEPPSESSSSAQSVDTDKVHDQDSSPQESAATNDDLDVPNNEEAPEIDPLDEAYSQDGESCKRTLLAAAKKLPGYSRAVFDGGVFKYAQGKNLPVTKLAKQDWIALHRAIVAGAFDYASGTIRQLQHA
jgi:hypothetical protein